MNRNALLVLTIIIATGAAAWFLLDWTEADSEHDAHAAPDMHKGPHGGGLLVDGNLALEITIFEDGIPPEFRIYGYLDGNPLPPDALDVRVELERLGGRKDSFELSPQGDYLRGSGVVVEPHSFDVAVTAGYQGSQHRWSYELHEGRTEIPAEMAQEVGIRTEIAGPAVLHEVLTLTGRVQTDPDRLSRVRPRFPGVVKTLQRGIGDLVEAGDTLASIQSNESLQTYPLNAPIGGLILLRHAQVGEATGEEPMFVIADLSQVWVELDVFGGDLPRVRAGQPVEIETFDGYRAEGVIDWVSPLASHASQSVGARVPLPNPQGALRPGQFVRGRVTVAEHQVPLAVKRPAVQRFRDLEVVFARYGDVYEVRMLEPGRRTRDWVEVLDGLQPGTEYVTENSYLIKADIEKAGASHDH
ncbi:MAG: efflux RND transporter periplasmic adaptor subunit [Gammaproteobacteria bacterium]|jgi:cobalt-zinc-cadmium efflux system membrane fusion protein